MEIQYVNSKHTVFLFYVFPAFGSIAALVLIVMGMQIATSIGDVNRLVNETRVFINATTPLINETRMIVPHADTFFTNLTNDLPDFDLFARQLDKSLPILLYIIQELNTTQLVEDISSITNSVANMTNLANILAKYFHFNNTTV